MADRFYGYQYDTNPRKLNTQYVPYRNRYPSQEEPVNTTNNKRKNNSYETQESISPEYGKKQVSSKTKKINRGVQRKNDVRQDDDAFEGTQNTKESKTNIKARLKIVLFLFAGFSVLFAISYQNSLISESFNKKEQYKKEMEALSKTNQQIEVSIEHNLNLNNIEQEAKEKLGMQKLNNSQKIYVNLPKQDYVAPAGEQIIMEEDTNFFQKLIGLFR